MTLTKKEKDKIEKTFKKQQVKDALNVIDLAYKNKIPLGNLRAYVEDQLSKK